jgi:large subunit ribosomal protein L24
MGPKRENEVPISINDVRLVIPYETTQIVRELNRETGIEEERSKKVFQDVIVDKVHMKRHTTGIDPFTGTDYGANEIPKDHQYDPVSGLPIFHRYIAGTNHRIEWPWDMEKAAEDSQAPEEDSRPKKTWGQTLNPLSLFKRNKEPKASTITPEVNVVDEYTSARQAHDTTRKTRPKSVDPEHMEAWDDVDTTRNIVEQGNDMSYTLIAPPFPDTLSEELRGHAADFNAEARKDFDKDAPRPAKVRAKRSTEQGDIAKEIAKAKHLAAQRMKTPMQLRWETEQAKKVKALKKAPLVSTEELMKALGRHMQVQRKGGRRV